MSPVEPDAELGALRSTLRSAFARDYPTSWVRGTFDDPSAVARSWSQLAELGVAGLLVAADYGGSDGSVGAAVVVAEEIGRALLPVPFLSSGVMAAHLIATAAPEPDRRLLLPAMASGRAQVAVALLEWGSYDWHHPGTTAERAGGQWRLTGHKAPVLDGASADSFVVSAMAPEGLRLFLVPSSQVAVTRLATIDPTRRFADLRFRNAESVILMEDDPAELLAATFDLAIVCLVADGLGTAESALEMATAYAKDRVAFGRPIGSFQAVQRILTDMFRAVELTRVAVGEAALLADEPGSSEQLHQAAAAAMAFGGDALQRVGAQAIQVFGGIGFTWEHDVGLHYKRLAAAGHIYGGSAEFSDSYARATLSNWEAV